MLIDGDYSHCGEHYIIFSTVESLAHTPGTNITLSINYISKMNFFLKEGCAVCSLWPLPNKEKAPDGRFCAREELANHDEVGG